MDAEVEAFGVVYSAGDVKVRALGRTFEGISKIKYGSKQPKTNIKGLGRRPIKRIRGGFDYECAITFKAYEMDAMQKAGGRDGVLGLKMFDVIVTYLDEDNGLIKKDIIKNAEFTDDMREIQGEGEIETECTMIVSDILRNQ